MKVFTSLLVLMALAAPTVAGEAPGPSMPLAPAETVETRWLVPRACGEPAEAARRSSLVSFNPHLPDGEAGAGRPPARLTSLAALAWQDVPPAERTGMPSPADDVAGHAGSPRSIDWGPLLSQSLLYSVFQHSVRLGFEDGPWEETLEGPFWEDYINSVKGLCCWDDGDRNTTNYLFHPLLGSAAAMVFANNHRQSRLTPPGADGYWNAKLKQGLYSAAYSTYFELGPLLSETALGNVGLDHAEQTYLDLVITPVFGTLWSAAEDYMRLHWIEPVDRRNHFWGATMAIFLNPTRSFSNLLAFRTPWDDPAWLKLQREQPRR